MNPTPSPVTPDQREVPAHEPKGRDGAPLRGSGVRFDHVSKVFTRHDGSDLQAIDSFATELPAGSFVTLVGPSGCGKSTLLSIAAGLEQPTRGAVYIGTERVTGPSREVGVVFQDDSTLPWRSVLANVAFGLEMAGVPKAERNTKARQMIQLVGLEGFEDEHPRRLSGGMRQRVAIARALALEPRILLMDEPFGALDQQTRLLVGSELVEIWRQTRCTILLVTHDIQEAVLMSERVWVMSFRPGRIIDDVAVDLPSDRDSTVISDPNFSAITGRIWQTVRTESLRAFQAGED